MENNLNDLLAEIDMMEKSSSDAPAELSGCSPEVLKARLKTLLTDEKYEQALALVEPATFSEVWAEEAIAIYLFNHREQDASNLFSKLMESTDPIEDRLKRDRLYRVFADSIFRSTFTKGSTLYADNLSEGDRKCLEKIWDTTSSLALDIAKGKITSKLHHDIVHYARIAAILLKKNNEAKILANALKNFRPISSVCAEDILAGLIDADADTVRQLRIDHPDDFRVRLWCCHIECEILKNFSAAFCSAELIATDKIAKSADDKKELGRFLFAVSLQLSGQQRSDALRIITQDLELSGLPVALLKAHGLFEKKCYEQALLVLDEAKGEGENDPAWLDAYSQVLRNMGEEEKAIVYKQKQCSLVQIPEVLKENAMFLHEHGADEAAIYALEKALELQSDDEYSLYNLAVLYYKTEKNFPKAIECLKKLIELKGDSDERRLFLAQLYFKTNERSKVIEILDPLCDREVPLIQAVVNKASALNLERGPSAAFDFIKQHKERFWTESSFVGFYMTVASAAGQEDDMGDALKQMLELDKTSGNATPMLKRVDLDEMKEMIESSAKQTRQRADYEVKGYLPWVDREVLLNNAIYWGWCRRTYDSSWICEDRFSRDENQIYASNAFNLQKDQGNNQSLLPITAPQKGADVVFDVSALITLQELGLLKTAFSFFSTVYLPVEYLTLSNQKSGLIPHQRSQRDFATEVERLLVERRIKVAPSSLASDMVEVDEYLAEAEDRTKSIGLAELVIFLKDKGAVNDIQCQQILRTVDQDRINPEQRRVHEGSSIRIALSSFQTLCSFHLETALIDQFDVCLSEADVEEVRRRIASFEFQKATLEKHEALWRWLQEQAKSGKLVFTPHSPDAEMRKLLSPNPEDHIAFVAGSLAQSKALPYCADDRACQLLTNASFGTPQILDALYAAELLTLPEYSKAYLTMLGWRYRFLVVPAEVLNYFAVSFKSALPGADLKRIALYIHDCMRDEGLNSAMMPTEPPVTLSMRYFITWIAHIAEFLSDAWLNPDFETAQLTKLTDWVAYEMLPSVPRTLKGVLHMNLGNLMSHTLISQMLLHSMTAKYPNRLDQAMKKIKETLQMPDAEYLDIVTEVLSHVDQG